MKKMIDLFWKLLSNMAFLCFVSMLVIMILQVFFRYLFKISVSWTDEGSRYFFIWAIFLASALAQRNKEHIRIEMVSKNSKGLLFPHRSFQCLDLHCHPHRRHEDDEVDLWNLCKHDSHQFHLYLFGSGFRDWNHADPYFEKYGQNVRSLEGDFNRERIP
jgi:hypothetical protein